MNIISKHSHMFSIGLFFLITTLSLHAENMKEENHVFTMSPDDQLTVKVHDADLIINTTDSGSEGKIQVIKEAKRMSEENAELSFKRHQIICEQKHNQVIIKSEINKLIPRNNGLKKGYLKIVININIPKQTEVSVKTSDGDIDLSGIEQNVTLRTSDGDILVKKVTGDLNLQTSDGDISTEEITGELTISTSDGDLTAKNIIGDVTLRSSDGNIRINHVEGAVQANTSDGNVVLENLKGNINAVTSDGNITATLLNSPTEDCKLITSDGNLKLMLGEEVSASINAKVNDGYITMNHPRADVSKLSKNHLNAQINDGGSAISIITSDGNIMIQQKK